MVLSDEVNPSADYKATMEDVNRPTEVQLFTQIPETEFTKPGSFDTDNDNHKVSQLFSVGGSADPKKMGPAVLLKVMAGDKFYSIQVSGLKNYFGRRQCGVATKRNFFLGREVPYAV